MVEVGHGGAGDLHTIFYKLFKLMKHPISPSRRNLW
jgi:hypothetical protein|tara:strand:- start:2148 stop:2255 length:108 start_codon:yes stop_codon:yes gene_type:complete